MKNLIRNIQHFSHHYTYLVNEDSGKIVSVEKKTFSKEGVDSLCREEQGLRWYCQTVGRNPSDIIESFVKTEKYCKLTVKYHSGELLSKPVNPDLVKSKITAAVEHYLETFSRDDFRFSHGDYFLGNLIFSDNKIVWIIDWEHFNEKLPAGYDAVNCIVEVFLSSYRNAPLFTKSSIETAKILLSEISKRVNLSEKALKYPASWCRETVIGNRDIWGLQYNKLPSIAYSYQRCAEVDRVIGL